MGIKEKYIQYAEISDDLMYGRLCLKVGIPWITPGSFRYLLDVIEPDWKVFEWGSGGSTVFWANNCAEVVSIEHNKDWITRVTGMLKGAKNVDLRYVRGKPKGVKDRFRHYADVINEYPDEYFDLVFNDGEASSRGWALNNSMPKIKIGGYLLLDNSSWLKRDISKEGFEFIGEWVERNLHWIGQRNPFNWETAIYRRME